MSNIIGLDAGHGLYTAGKQTPTGIKEWTINDKVCDYATEYLEPYDTDILRTDGNEGNKDEPLQQRVQSYIKAGVKAFASVHHNAFTADWNDATGVEVYVDKNATDDDLKFAEIVYNKLVKYTGLRGRGIKRADFTVIKQNDIPAILIEGGFMDSTNDYKIITSEEGQRAYARAVAEGFIEFCKLQKKQQEMYRVAKEFKNGKFVGQIGAFRSKDNAINLCKKNKNYYVFDSKGSIIYSNIEVKPVEPPKPQPKPQPKPEVKPQPIKPTKNNVTYQVWDDSRNAWLSNVTNNSDYAGIYGHNICCIYANVDMGNIKYAVHVKGGKWLPQVTNREDYAGIFNKPIDGLMMKVDKGTIHYQVHLRKTNKWLPYVTGYNTKDSKNGYAGILGQEIDAIRIYID